MEPENNDHEEPNPADLDPIIEDLMNDLRNAPERPWGIYEMTPDEGLIMAAIIELRVMKEQLQKEQNKDKDIER